MLWDLQVEIIGKVALAILLGGIIGLEREVAKKPAGVRTNMLITGAASLLVAIGDIQVARFENSEIQEFITIDPIRTVEAIIVGLSFIGALIGAWIARSLALPELFVLRFGDTKFPIVWSIIGGALFVAVISIFNRTGRGRRRV
ncbi:hypothetical protein GF337_09750 [candidate division KSB1 bacterium]|nr:hypothetical protein [candidate division KSB1 bacterium]